MHLLDYNALIQGMNSDWVFRAEDPIPVGMPYQNSSYWTKQSDPETAVEYWNEAMQDPVFIDTMNTIGCEIPFALSSWNDTTTDLVSLQLKEGFDAMKQLLQMNMTGLNHEPEISLHPPSHPWFPSSFPIDRDLIHLSVSGARYADPDAFVFPSIYEGGFAYPPLEAMACGIPTIITKELILFENHVM